MWRITSIAIGCVSVRRYGQKITPATPPFAASARRFSSLVQRGRSDKARAPVWLISGGVFVARMPSVIVCGAPCARSTTTFSALSRSTISYPNRLSPAWLANFIGIWSKLPDSQPPTDQLPLCCSLDHLGLATVDLGDWVNWPVSKQIGGTKASVPSEVIGAHGGFPLSEWRRYLENPGCALTFIGQAETRKLRYLRDDAAA